MSKQIQWFPGHMAKALNEMKKSIKIVDMSFVLLDARIPHSSLNPEVIRIVKSKPVVLLFNKSDLADQNILQQWINHYQKKGFYCYKLNSRRPILEQEIISIARSALSEKIKQRSRKGMKFPIIRSLITGIPNVGKSTFINRVTKSSATRTANTPGVTKAQQWIKMDDNFHLLDTPGVLWPKFENTIVGYNLAITGAIKDSILPQDDVAIHAIRIMQKHYPQALTERYGKESLNENVVDVLDAIGVLRGALMPKNEIDYLRVYQIILTDLRSGQLGGICLERVND